MKNAFWLAVCASLSPAVSLAQDAVVAMPRPSDAALVVGIEDYAFLPDIAGVRATSNAWDAWFRESLGVKNVEVLHDASAVREEILAAAGRLHESGADRVWVVWVGHGAPSTLGGMLLGADTQGTQRSVDTRGVSQQELIAAARGTSNAEVVLVTDACFSGQGPNGEPVVPNVQAVIPAKLVVDLPRTVVLSAAASNEVAGPTADGTRPAFSFFLLEGLRGAARGDDYDVTAREAASYAATQLRRVAGRVQTPQVAGPAEFRLVQGEGLAPVVAAHDASPKDTTPSNTQVASQSAVEPAKPALGKYWLSSGAGIGMELKSEDFTPLASVRGGVHVGRADDFKWRLGADLTYVRSSNPNHREFVDALEEVETAVGASLGRPVDGQAVEHVLGSLVVGAAWDVGVVLGAEATAGLNVAPWGRCDRWQAQSEAADTDFSCASHAALDVNPIVGGRLTAQLGAADISTVFHLDLGGEQEAYAGLLLAFSFDR